MDASPQLSLPSNVQQSLSCTVVKLTPAQTKLFLTSEPQNVLSSPVTTSACTTTPLQRSDSSPPSKKFKSTPGIVQYSSISPTIAPLDPQPIIIHPSQLLSLNAISAVSTMSGRNTNNSNKGNKTNNNKGAKPSKSTLDSNKDNNEVGVAPETSSPGTPAGTSGTNSPASVPTSAKSLADQVIAHFSARWDVYTTGLSDDIATITKTLQDEADGLVPRVQSLETKNATITQRVGALETASKTPATIDASFARRLTAVEKLCSSTDPQGLGTKLNAIQDKLDKIADVNSDGGVTLKIEDINYLQSEVGILRNDVDTMGGYIHTKGRNLQSVEHKTTMNTAKLMRNTLIFGGVRSSEDQSATDALKVFLVNILQVPPGPEDIFEAVKLGRGYTKWVVDCEIHFPPPIRARCSELFAAKVMKYAYTLDKKQDEELHFKYYIRYSKLEALRAIQDKHSDDIKQYKETNVSRGVGEPKINFYFNGNRFFVNGEVIEEDITPPSLRIMMSISEATQDQIEKLVFSSGGPLEEKYSLFQAYAIGVDTLDDINFAYMRVRQLKKFADHIVLAYCLKNAEGFKEGGSNDREYYGDREILKVIKAKHAVNVAIFVAREYGGVPLGARHFEIIRSVATDAINDLDPATISADKEPIATQRSAPLPHQTRWKRLNNLGSRGHGPPPPWKRGW